MEKRLLVKLEVPKGVLVALWRLLRKDQNERIQTGQANK